MPETRTDTLVKDLLADLAPHARAAGMSTVDLLRQIVDDWLDGHACTAEARASGEQETHG